MTTSLAAGLVLGYLADLVVGDPRRGHPVALFGSAAAALERRVWADDRRAGIAYTTVCVTVPAAAVLVTSRALRTRPAWHTAFVAACTWVALGGRSLRAESAVMSGLLGGTDGPDAPRRGVDHDHRQTTEAVKAESDRRPTVQAPDGGAASATTAGGGDLDAARARLSHLCSRDATGLTRIELARATVESVAENTSDAVVAPLVWGALAGAPGIVAYRAANTLDAMVGYRTERYDRFGWASARLDDALNVVPSRLTAALTVLLAPTAGGSPAAAWRAWRRDAPAHPSPNAGPVEASAAGALGVVLGGSNRYGDRVEDRGRLGAHGGREVDVDDIRRTAALTSLVGAAGLTVCVGLALAVDAVNDGARHERTQRG